MKKIALVGPECSGKSYLCKELASFYNCSYTEEYARIFLENKIEYKQADLLTIAKGQIKLEEQKNEELLFCDTNPLSIAVWSEIKYGIVKKELQEFYKKHNNYDLTLLLHPDIPYQNDSLRESPKINERVEIFHCFKKHLKNRKHIEISGSYLERIKKAKEAVQSILNQ